MNQTPPSQTRVAPTLDQEVIADKEIRVAGDAVIQQIRALPPTAERTLAMRKFQEGVMWIGMDLKRINEIDNAAAPNPYPHSKDPSNTKIDPTADNLKL